MAAWWSRRYGRPLEDRELLFAILDKEIEIMSFLDDLKAAVLAAVTEQTAAITALSNSLASGDIAAAEAEVAKLNASTTALHDALNPPAVPA